MVPRRAQGSFGQALISQLTGCYLRVWVDGIMLNNETQVYDLDQMPIASLAGLELYVGFQETPVEFEAPGVHCGALVLWTRDR